MKYLFDVSRTKAEQGCFPPIITAGQLLTPLTGYRLWADVYAIDNGAFSGFREAAFFRLLHRERHTRSRCLYVSMPDIVGDAAGTLELFHVFKLRCRDWPLALVAQDGLTQDAVPWDEIVCLFLGGRDPWKDSIDAQKLVIAAKRRNKLAHIGRVNALDRFVRYAELGADTCDGSGVSRYPNVKLPLFLPYQRAFHERASTRTENAE